MTAQASPRRSLTIRGYLTLTSHSHQAAPTSDETGVTSHMKTPVLAGGKLIPDVPFITANSVRALIRRACGNVLFDQIKKMHDQVPRNVYLSVQRGGFARTGMLAGGASYQQLIAAKDHMFSGLFGGGAFMYPSCVRMESSLIPMITTLKDLFPDRYQAVCADIRPNQTLCRTLIASRDDFERLPEGDIIENPESAYLEHMTQKFGSNAAKKAQANEARSTGAFVSQDQKVKSDDLATYTQVETMIPGLPLYFSMSVTGATEAHIGLLLAGLQAWANKNALGGGTVRGRGSFKQSLQVFENGQEIVSNLLINEAPNYQLAGQVQHFVDAMNRDLEEAAKPKTLASIYPSELAEKPAKKGKKAEANAEAA